MRRMLAKELMSTGMRETEPSARRGFSKSRAGPPVLTERSANSADFETGVDFERDALQFFIFFESADEIAEVVVCHVLCQGCRVRRLIYYDCKFI